MQPTTVPKRMQSSSATTVTINRLQQQANHLAKTPEDHTMPSKALKILMLHGFTQNGPLFHAKTKVLEKFLTKVFPGTTFAYPTGPLRLKPSDVPGFDPSSFQSDDDASEHYGWWRRSNTAEPPEYVGFHDGLTVIAKVLKEEGPFDGVMGFSQGAAAAAIVASLLEAGRQSSFEHARTKSSLAINFPQAFADLQHPPMKFCVAYCGFAAPGERYTALYEPKIATLMCHVLGTLDSVVDEDKAHTLVTAAGGESHTTVIMHPGGHFVPTGKQYLEAVGGFIKQAIENKGKPNEEEENVEDMDVPF